MGDLVQEDSSLTDVLLLITHKDIGNEVSRILAKRREFWTAKKNMYEKKRLHSLPIMVRPDEIVIAVKAAVEQSFMNVKNTLSALSRRGWYPYKRRPLMDPQILISAPEEVWQERTDVLCSRGITHKESTFSV